MSRAAWAKAAAEALGKAPVPAGAALLLVLVLCTYRGILNAPFFWDDYWFIVHNPVVIAPPGLAAIWLERATTDYWPLSYSVLWALWQAGGGAVLAFHLASLLLHAANAALLWVVLRGMAMPGAFLAALLFAVHPVNVESVAWAFQIKTLLPLTFCLGSLLPFRAFAAGGPRRGLAYGAALLLFTAGMLAKSSVALWPVVLVGDLWRQGRLKGRAVLLAMVPFFVVAVALTVVALSWYPPELADPNGIGALEVDRPIPLRLAEAGWNFWLYLEKSIIPTNLMLVYPAWGLDTSRWTSYLPTAAAAGCLTAAWLARGKAAGRPIFSALGYYALAIMPALGLVNVSYMAYAPAADHWQYLASAGIMAAAAAALARLMARWPTQVLAGVAAVLAAALSYGATAHSLIFADDQVAWSDAVANNQGSWMTHASLGLVLKRRGELAPAEAELIAALRLNPTQAEVLDNLGIMRFRAHRTGEAIDFYRRAVAARPGYVNPLANLGTALLASGQADEGEALLRQAVSRKPNLVEAHRSLGHLARQRRQWLQAEAEYELYRHLRPESPTAYLDLGALALDQEHLDEARGFFAEALARSPEPRPVHARIAQLLMEHGRGEDAEAHRRAAEAAPLGASVPAAAAP